MSNRAALRDCFDLIEALEECQQRGFMEKLRGACFDLEQGVRMCRHEARKANRREHVLAARERANALAERMRRSREGEYGEPSSEA